MPKIARGILSCHDKRGLVPLAKTLREFGVEIISTSGTLTALHEAGVEAASIADFTGVRELMDGRVKSLHPKVHAGLLGIRDNKLHQEEMAAYEMQWIDLIVVNLQPVEELISRATRPEEVFEQIDIGGAAMVRSAAKNYRYVTAVVNPERYGMIKHELLAHEGEVSFPARCRLAREAFACTAAYDGAIAEYLRKQEPPEE